MAKLQVKDLNVGMVVSSDIYSRAGQLIVRKNSLLTRQMIAHLKYYAIEYAEVTDSEQSAEVRNAMNARATVETTQLAKLLRSKEYKVFCKDYSSDVRFLQNSVNDIIMRNAPVNTPELIERTVKIFNSSDSFYSLFGMLHSMKQIDDSTFAHSVNVALISRLIGTWNHFDEEALDLLTLAGLLHDIGKCQIPDAILMKPDRLTDEEYKIIKQHPQYGYDYIKDRSLAPMVKRAILLHHERCDGSGYPFGYTIDKLSDFECIISIADVYDAMTADRCYRSGLCPFDVIACFENEGLQKYHPKYITTFLQKIADSYLNSDVLLSNNMVARVVYINKRLTRPIVQLPDRSFINLLDIPDLYIQSII